MNIKNVQQMVLLMELQLIINKKFGKEIVNKIVKLFQECYENIGIYLLEI